MFGVHIDIGRGHLLQPLDQSQNLNVLAVLVTPRLERRKRSRPVGHNISDQRAERTVQAVFDCHGSTPPSSSVGGPCCSGPTEAYAGGSQM